MRGTLRGVRTRVERLIADVQGRADGPDWEQIVGILRRRRTREKTDPATRERRTEILDGQAIRARRLREAGYL